MMVLDVKSYPTFVTESYHVNFDLKNEKWLPTDAFQHPTKAIYALRSIERVKRGFLFVISTHHNSLTKTRKKRLIKIKTSLYRHKIVVAIYHSDVIIVS